MNRRGRRLLAVFVVGILPWTVLVYPGGQEVYFAYGLLTHAGAFHTLPAYLSMTVPDYLPFSSVFSILPDRLLAWPASAGLWVLALASAALGGYEDRRVTEGLLAIAGLSQFVFAIGFWTSEGYLALPTGGVLLVALAWWDRRSDRAASGRR